MVWSLAQARVVISDLKADYNRRRRHRIDFRASALGLRGAGPSGACPAHPASSDRRPGRAKSSEDSNAPEGRSRRSSRSSGAATACAWPMRSTRRAHPRLGCLVGATVPIASWDGTRADTGREVRRWGPLDRGHGSEAGRGVGAAGGIPTMGSSQSRTTPTRPPASLGWFASGRASTRSLGRVEASRRRRQLGRLAASRIQAVDGVTRTLQLRSDPPVAEEAVATTATPSSRCVPASAPQKQELLAPPQPAPAERQLGDLGSVAGT